MSLLDREEKLVVAVTLDVLTLVSFLIQETVPVLGSPVSIIITAPLFIISVIYAASLFLGTDTTIAGLVWTEKKARRTVNRLRNTGENLLRLTAFLVVVAILAFVLAKAVAGFAWIPVATLAYAVVNRERIVERVMNR